MIHYHGTPITPKERLYELAGRNFCTSYAHPHQVKICHAIGQSNMLDNGAFTAWTQGKDPNWTDWRDWVEPWLDYQTSWAVLPDSVGGGEKENDDLLVEHSSVPRGAPVWHLHEPIARLVRLCSEYERVCFGSSGSYRNVGSSAWHLRVSEAFNEITDADGKVRVWIHMLRGMSLSGSQYPFASVDSTDVARNHNRNYGNVVKMADRWDRVQCPARWTHHPLPTQLFQEEPCPAL